MPDSTLPTMSIRFLHPVFDALVELGCTEVEMAAQLSVNETDVRDAKNQVPANVVYRFLIWAAERSGDPYFAVYCGKRRRERGCISTVQPPAFRDT